MGVRWTEVEKLYGEGSNDLVKTVFQLMSSIINDDRAIMGYYASLESVDNYHHSRRRVILYFHEYN